MRFEECSDDVYQLMEDVIENEQRHVREAAICLIYDLKKRKSGEKYIIGRIKATGEELKTFAVNEAGQMYDYIMFLDKEVFLRISDEERKAVIYHELCHCKVTDSEINPYKIQGHEIETFYSEIDRNQSDPRLWERLGAIASAVHDPENHEMPE